MKPSVSGPFGFILCLSALSELPLGTAVRAGSRGEITLKIRREIA